MDDLTVRFLKKFASRITQGFFYGRIYLAKVSPDVGDAKRSVDISNNRIISP